MWHTPHTDSQCGWPTQYVVLVRRCSLTNDICPVITFLRTIRTIDITQPRIEFRAQHFIAPSLYIHTFHRSCLPICAAFLLSLLARCTHIDQSLAIGLL